MSIDSIVQSISTLGFPAVMCIVLFWRMDKQDDNYKNIINKMTDTVAANTTAIEKLSEKINALYK